MRKFTCRGRFSRNLRLFAPRLEASRVGPGPGDIGGAEIVQNCRTLIPGIYTGVESLTDQGMVDVEMKPVIVERLSPAFETLAGFDEDNGPATGFAYPAVEENAF